MAPLGVYIHFPWCRTLCPYCDFPRQRVPKGGQVPAQYTEAVLGELAERAGEVQGRRLVSIYFGGGTPSLWPADGLGRVIDAVAGRFAVAADRLEVTLEANPRDCAPAALAGWRAAGVNRLSIGVQALQPAALVTLGRDHDVAAARAALAAATAAGFDRLSADLILGVPGPGDPLADFRELAGLAELGHLSIYELTIKPGTPFAAAVAGGRLVPLDDDLLADRYREVDALLTGSGFVHYEVSNYARPGQRAVHNSLYWSGAEFLGLGAGAASFVRRPEGGGVRLRNLAEPERYLGARGAARHTEVEELGSEELERDLLWLGMRTADGVEEARFAGFEPLVAGLVRDHLAVREDGRIRPTMRGFLFADHVAAAIVAARRYTPLQAAATPGSSGSGAPGSR